jgi:predicted phosphoribosyltransferase
MYKDREDAGEQLAEAIKNRGYKSPIIFGLTRGGVPVAAKIASVLGIPLKGLVVRKLGVPFYPELGFGAIAPLGVLVVDETIVDEVGLDHNQIQSVKSQEEKELLRRLREYQIDKEVQDLSDATAIITDDGIATGTSMLAAVRYLRKFNPQKLVVAVPVCPKVVGKTIEKEVDDFICLDKEELFFGVGEFYEDFEQVSDQEVRNLLNK